MQFLKSFYQKRLQEALLPTDVFWDQSGVCFHGDLTEAQVRHHGGCVLAGNFQAGLRRALKKGAVVYIERPHGSLLGMDVDWYASPSCGLTLFEEESLRRTVNWLQAYIQRVAESLQSEARQLMASCPIGRNLVRSHKTSRFTVDVYEVPADTNFDLDDQEVETLYRDIEAGKRRFCGLVAEVKAAGVKLGDAYIPGVISEETTHAHLLNELSRQAIEDARQFIAGVTL